MIAGIFIGLLLVALAVSILISYHYHQLAKGLLIYNNKLDKRKKELEKENSKYVIDYYQELGKKNRLFKMLKQIRMDHHLEKQNNALLRIANEQIWDDRYHAGYIAGYTASEQRVTKKDLSNIKLGKDGFIESDK